MFIHRPRSGRLTEGRCHASVHDRDCRSFITYQCNRKAIVQRTYDEAPHWFCHQHDPITVAKRRKASQDKYDEQIRQRTLPYDKANHYEHVLNRIVNIEHGNLDAKRLAAKALAKFK